MKTWKKRFGSYGDCSTAGRSICRLWQSNSDEAAGSGNTVKLGFITDYTGPGAAYVRQ